MFIFTSIFLLCLVSSVLDVAVEQSCSQYLTDTGTVILHCDSAGDISAQKQERERLIEAIETRDEQKLKNVLNSAANIPSLSPLLQQADVLLKEVIEHRRQECKAKGIEFKSMFASESKSNSSKIVRVLDVMRPYQVLDDLSYKITKSLRLDTRAQVARQSGFASGVNQDRFEITNNPMNTKSK